MKKQDYRKLYLAEKKERQALEKEIGRLESQLCEKNTRYQIALERLTEIAAGFYPGDFYKEWSHENKLMRSAAVTLKTLARRET